MYSTQNDFCQFLSEKILRLFADGFNDLICSIGYRLSYPLRLALLDTSPYISVSYHFFAKKWYENLRKD